MALFGSDRDASLVRTVNRELINNFIDELTGDQFERVVEFFNTMPKLRHVVKVKNPNTKVESEVVLEGLESFLG